MSAPEIATDTVHCRRCHADVLIELIATEGRSVPVLDMAGQVVAFRPLVAVSTTPDTKSAIDYHESGRCLA